MALQALYSSGHIQGDRPARKQGTETNDVSLAFAFDSGYLMPFKVMIYSLCQQGSLLDCPVVVYSDDPTVFDDPIVQLVTDKPRLLATDQRNELYELAKTRVKRPERADWNKGTFLKWAIFEPQPTARLLFLDVDMLCLAPLEPLLAADHAAELVAAPQFQTSIYKVKEEPRPKEAVEAILLDMMKGRYTGPHRTRLNSGLMLLKPSLLSHEFYKELVAWSQRDVMINEQRHLSSLFEGTSHSLQMIPVTYNFQERYLDFLSTTEAAKALQSIRVLHFAGSGKPWKAGSHRSRNSQALWFKCYFDMCNETRLHGSGTPRA